MLASTQKNSQPVTVQVLILPKPELTMWVLLQNRYRTRCGACGPASLTATTNGLRTILRTLWCRWITSSQMALSAFCLGKTQTICSRCAMLALAPCLLVFVHIKTAGALSIAGPGALQNQSFASGWRHVDA